jgi:hypothetical protein
LNLEFKIKHWPANWNVSQLLFDPVHATMAALGLALNQISHDLQNLINQSQHLKGRFERLMSLDGVSSMLSDYLSSRCIGQ